MKLLKILIYLLIFNSFVLAGFLVQEYNGQVVKESQIEAVNLTRIIDGDTIDTSLGRVRMLGINTPEKDEPDYELGKNYLPQFLGKQIKIERTIEDKDKYTRLLRYVFYQDVLLNEEILKNGWAHFYAYNDDKYDSRLLNAEENARNSNLGIWEKSKDVCAHCILLVKLNEKDPGEYVLLKNNCDFDCNLNRWFVKDDASNKRILNFTIGAKKEYKIDYAGRVWNDAGDSFYLRDASGKLVLFYRYGK